MKTPKLYFYDAGLASHLLGIRTARHLHQHPLRGALFETWVVSEIVKARVHRGLSPSLYHYRDRKGREVDVVLERDGGLVAVEIKSARTIASDFFASLERFASGLGASERFAPVEPVLVYGGTVAQQRTRSRVLPWSTLHRHDWCRSGRP